VAEDLPRVERVARRFRRELLRSDRAALRRVSGLYAEAINRATALAADYHAGLVAEAERLGVTLAEVSKPPFHPSWALQRDRLEILTREIGADLRRIEPLVRSSITGAQRDAIGLALDHAEAFSRDLVTAGVPRNLRDRVSGALGSSWARPPVEAFENLVGVLADGSPLEKRLRGYGAEAVEAIRREMGTSFLLGEGPELMAQRLRGPMGGNRARAMVVSRTETVRAYRYATHEGYRANADIVPGWIWSADLGPNTCAACIEMNGTRHPLSETLYDHPNGRCAPIPETASNADLAERFGIPELAEVPDVEREVRDGAEWLAEQPAAIQDQILGGARGALYRDGTPLSDLTTRRPNRTWGPSIGVKPLRDVS
jgi:hypothetical protein